MKVGLDHVIEPYRTLLKALLDALLRVWKDNLVSLVLFGSIARGDYRSDSDIDLLIVGKNLPRSRFARQDMFIEAEDLVQPLLDDLHRSGIYVDFSPIILSVEEAKKFRPIYLDMVEDAIILFDRDRFFQEILYSLKRRLEALGAHRVWVGRRWYWVLKDPYRFGEVIEI